MIDNKQQEELRQRYNPDGSQLRTMQLQILEILKVVDDICRNNNITYWLASGTLLGAVRHGGFIPWDDDIDIEILRKDRKRFIAAFNNELPSNLHLQYHEEEPNYYLNILKVRADSSDIGEKLHLGKNGDYESNYKYRGFFIDVFCVEPCVPFFLKISNRFLSWILIMRYVKRKGLLLCHFMWVIMEFLNSIFRFIGLFLSDDNYLYQGLSSCFGVKYRYNKKYIKQVRPISFEGYEFYAPIDPDGYLKDMYGDYLQIPSEILRSSHHSTISDF